MGHFRWIRRCLGFAAVLAAPGVGQAAPTYRVLQVYNQTTNDGWGMPALNNAGQLLVKAPAGYGLPAGSLAVASGFGPDAGTIKPAGYDRSYYDPGQFYAGGPTGRLLVPDVGYQLDPQGNFRYDADGRVLVQAQASILSPGNAVQPLGTLGGLNSTGRAMNDRGQVVGTSDTAAGPTHAFLAQNGTMADLGTLVPGKTSTATAINNAGQVVGFADTGRPISEAGVAYAVADVTRGAHAVRFEGGRAVDLGTLGGASSVATGINDAGTIIGTSETTRGEAADDARRVHAFAIDAGRMTDLGTLAPDPSNPLAGDWSKAVAINRAGQIVGTSNDRGFLYDHGAMTALDDLISADLGMHISYVIGFNDFGQILAYATSDRSPSSFFHVLLTPDDVAAAYAVPEPTALALFGGLGAILAARALRRRRPA